MIENYSQAALRTQVFFLTILCITVFAVFGLLLLLPKPVLPDSSIVLEYFKGALFPEPIERTIFLILSATIPIFAFILTRKQTLFDTILRSKFANAGIPLIVAIILFLPLYNSDLLGFISPNSIAIISPHPNNFLFLSLGVAFLCCIGIVNFRPPKNPSPRSLLPENGSKMLSHCLTLQGCWRAIISATRAKRTVVWIIFIIAMLLQIASWRIASINSVSENQVWATHFDTAIYATSQVVGGKTLLVDLHSQYGLFPELIAPLMKLFGLTVFNFILFFAALQIISLIGLFFTLTKLVRHSAVLLLSGISLITLTFGTVYYFFGSYDGYYQYWPIRFFWPAFSVPVFYYFIQQKTLVKSAVVSFVGAIGSIWCLDTGLFVTLSFMAYLGVKFIILLPRSFQDRADESFPAKKYILALCLHIIITILVLSIFLFGLWLKANQPLHLSWLYSYQKLYYGLGFVMMPIPRQIHPWMSVLGIYLLGLIIALMSWYQHIESIRADIIFYLSLLGLGLFVYYQGRSHVLNLFSVCWPALMIIAITAESTLKRIRQRTLPLTEIWSPITAVTLLLMCTTTFITHVPRMVREMQYRFATRHVIMQPFIANELAFIKQHASSKHECLILSQRQGIYYAESGLASPIKGPGIIETFLKLDERRLVNQLFDGHIDCIFLGIGDNSAIVLKLDTTKLKQVYNVTAENTEHTMLYLTPKA